MGSSLVLLVLLILAAVLMFKKRFTFPWVKIAMLVWNGIYRLIDHAMASQISALTRHDEYFAQSIFQVMVGCAIWIPYFLVSKRVKATFRR